MRLAQEAAPASRDPQALGPVADAQVRLLLLTSGSYADLPDVAASLLEPWSGGPAHS